MGQSLTAQFSGIGISLRKTRHGRGIIAIPLAPLFSRRGHLRQDRQISLVSGSANGNTGSNRSRETALKPMAIFRSSISVDLTVDYRENLNHFFTPKEFAHSVKTCYWSTP